MKSKYIFGFVVLASCGIIYGVNYQREQEKLFMRRNVLKEIEERRLAKMKKFD